MNAMPSTGTRTSTHGFRAGSGNVTGRIRSASVLLNAKRHASFGRIEILAAGSRGERKTPTRRTARTIRTPARSEPPRTRSAVVHGFLRNRGF
jgi:hypothetical protein